MRLRRGLVLATVAGLATVGSTLIAYEAAQARARPAAVVRFLLGYFDARGRFVPTAGRNTTNVDRNALAMFIFSGPISSGPNIRATLPCTIDELDQTAACDTDPEEGFEPGVIPRRDSPFRGARIVATGSVSRESIRIASPSAGGGEALADGVFFKVTRGRRASRTIRNRVVFNPRFVAATFNQANEVDYNAEGLPALTQFQITMQGGDSVDDPINAVQNLSGSPLSSPFSATFTTSNRYVQDFTRPGIRTTAPVDGAVNVASDDDIEVTFSEPMLVSTFQPQRFLNDAAATVRVNFTTSSINAPALRGALIRGQVVVKPQTAGNVIQFRPLQGFGPGPSEVTVTITNGVTDLSGNNIIREQEFTFTTESDPNALSFSEIEETFTDNSQEDRTFSVDPGLTDNLLAVWNDSPNPDPSGNPPPNDPNQFTGAEGRLQTGVVENNFDAVSPGFGQGSNLWHPNPIKFQLLYPVNDMGSRPRTITGFDWFVRSPVLDLAGQSYPNTQIRMGHATALIAGSGFPGGGAPPGPVDGNFDGPITLVRPPATYAIPTSGLTGRSTVTGPPWNAVFNSNGVSSVIMEISHNGNGTAALPAPLSDFWERDGGYALNGMTLTFPASVPAVNLTFNHYYSARFQYLTPGAEAQSRWYSSGIDQLRYQPQVLIPFEQPEGTTVTFEWQGAKGDVNNPSILDANTITPWTTDIRELPNNRFVRFRSTFANNLISIAAPSVDSIIIPFTFR